MLNNQQQIVEGPRQQRSTSRRTWHAVAEPLPNAAVLGNSSSAVAVGAELQVLLAEVKRLSMHQEHLKRDVADVCAWEAQDGVAESTKKRAVPKLNGCKMTDCPAPALTVPFGRQAGSSDWSEAATETPVRNVISGMRSVCWD